MANMSPAVPSFRLNAAVMYRVRRIGLFHPVYVCTEELVAVVAIIRLYRLCK